jgi:hypothetical protein
VGGLTHKVAVLRTSKAEITENCGVEEEAVEGTVAEATEHKKLWGGA